MILPKEELLNVNGGAFSASWVNYLTRGIVFIFELGRSLGSSLRRLLTKNYCK